MKPNHDFVAERALAQHCAELFASEPSDEEQAADFAAFAARLERTLKERLASQLGGDTLAIACEDVGKRTAGSLFKAIGAAAANMLLDCGANKPPLIISFDYGAALALTEQAFGGEVRAVEADLAELPRSAWLVLENIAAQIGDSFAEAAEWSGSRRVLRSHENVAKLDALSKNAKCLVWPTSLKLAGDVELPFRLVTLEAAFLDCFDGSAGSGEGQTAGLDAAAQLSQFGGLPLPMRAVLAEMAIPVSHLARLKPGDFIPFSPRREVPLMMGDKAIARGRIGTLDDEVALNVTQIS